MLQIHLDHFVLGIKNLEQGMTEFAEKTGIEPVFGGIHEKIGTHNALVSLGHSSYLEILAPLDKNADPQSAFGKLDSETLKLVGWVLRINDSKALIHRLEDHLIPHSGILPLSRKTTLGTEIKWNNVFFLTNESSSVNPFFIEWENLEQHPSLTSPQGCILESFSINILNSDAISSFLKALHFEFSFSNLSSRNSGDVLQLCLKTPRGIICFE